MSQKNPWMARVVVLAVVAVVGAAFMTMLAGEPVTGSGANEATVCAASQSSGSEAWAADFDLSEAVGPQSSGAEPIAICRLRPECSSNSDCDLKCGVGLGKCVHSNCPVRICRCN